jgi:hypothetical protein
LVFRALDEMASIDRLRRHLWVGYFAVNGGKVPEPEPTIVLFWRVIIVPPDSMMNADPLSSMVQLEVEATPEPEESTSTTPSFKIRPLSMRAVTGM